MTFAKQVAQRIRDGVKPEPWIKLLPHNPRAVYINNWERAR